MFTYPCPQSNTHLHNPCWQSVTLSGTVRNRTCDASLWGIFKMFGTGWGTLHDDVIKWKHFRHCRPFVRVIHRWTVDSPDKGQWRGVSMFSLICAWTNASANNWNAHDLRCHCVHCDLTIMVITFYNNNMIISTCKFNYLQCQPQHAWGCSFYGPLILT